MNYLFLNRLFQLKNESSFKKTGDNLNTDISIIIPTYNAEKYLPFAIESIINQSFGFENIELLLIDDNSSDNTSEIIKEFSEEYPNIKAIFL